MSYRPVARTSFNLMLDGLLARQAMLARLRPVADYAIARSSPPVPGTRVQPGPPGIPGEWVWPPGVYGDVGVVLVLHGSGYLICSSRTHRGFASRVSKYSGMPAFVIDYRLAPEYPFPAAEDDALAAYRWLLDHGHHPTTIVVAGDSAGGHLAVGLALRAKAEGLPAPAGLALFGPLIDPAYRASIADPRTRCQPLDPRAAARAVALYVGDSNPADPRLCLLNADLADLPPTQVHYGSREVMRADAEAFAELVRTAGGRCEEVLWPGLMHAYWLWPRRDDGSLQSLKTAGEFLRTTVGRA
ncbi:alpha/beta hydrolase [Mycobacterium sp.]|uniref:alpha/beta hydrolase n=1 Tax=Mycobacterium sp. TaxID=1785 RepID=UPI0031E0DDF6